MVLFASINFNLSEWITGCPDSNKFSVSSYFFCSMAISFSKFRICSCCCKNFPSNCLVDFSAEACKNSLSFFSASFAIISLLFLSSRDLIRCLKGLMRIELKAHPSNNPNTKASIINK